MPGDDSLDTASRPGAEFLAQIDPLGEPDSAGTATSRPSHRPVDVGRVERIAELLARWELGSVHRLRAAAHHAVATEPEYLVLSELAARPTGLTGAALAGLVGIGSGGISGVLMRLEEHELLEREPDPDDGRSMVAFATDAGRDFVRNEVGDVAGLDGVAALVDGLRPYQIDLIAEFLDRATDRAYRQARHLRDARRRRR